jgi:glycosyltransferase involved in cell wall biosynthesis
MRILQLFIKFYPAKGGAVTHVHDISKELARRGHNVSIYTSTSLSNKDVPNATFFRSISDDNTLAQQETIDAIQVYRYPIRFRYWSFNWIPEMSKALRRAMRDFDIIHIHGYNVSISVIGCYYANRFKKPIVLTAHDVIIPPHQSFHIRLLKKLFDRTFGRYVLQSSDRVIALTQDNVDQYTRLGVDISKISVIPNGIRLEDYEKCELSNDTKVRYDESGENKTLIFVGRIAEFKGIQDIIEIMPEITREFSGARLLVVGTDDGYRQELEKMAANKGLDGKVIFVGEVPEDDLHQLYKLSDIFVFPSKMEAFGIVLLESMASGTLCIAYSIPGIRKVIRDGENGVLVHNKTELLQSILYYLGNPEEKQKIETNALAYVRKFDLKSVVDALEEVYQEVIN